MGKKVMKGVAFPIDWNTSPPDVSVDQVPKPRSHDFVPQVGISSVTQAMQIPPKPLLRSDEDQRHSHTASDIVSGGMHAPEESMFRPGKAAVDEAGGRTWRPDAFAHAFVPESLSAINQSPASAITTPAVDGIDYGNYISTFAGTQFLSLLEPPQISNLNHGLPVNTLDYLDATNYGQHLKDCIALDMNARIPEIRSYDLFAATLEVQHLTPHVYSLGVPGLRDGTPPISYGDSVLLRQLILDPATRLPRGMNHWLAPGGGLDRGLQAPGFTGHEISAVALGIDRANELLYLRAYGLILAGNPVCNVSFVVQGSLITSMERAVANVATQLAQEGDWMQLTNIAEGPTGAFIRRHSVPHQHMGPSAEGYTMLTALKNGKQPPTPPSAMLPASTMGQYAISADQSQRNNNCWLQRMLFPEKLNGVQQKDLPSAVFPQRWFDINLNYEQKVCVPTPNLLTASLIS